MDRAVGFQGNLGTGDFCCDIRDMQHRPGQVDLATGGGGDGALFHHHRIAKPIEAGIAAGVLDRRQRFHRDHIGVAEQKAERDMRVTIRRGAEGGGKAVNIAVQGVRLQPVTGAGRSRKRPKRNQPIHRQDVEIKIKGDVPAIICPDPAPPKKALVAILKRDLTDFDGEGIKPQAEIYRACSEIHRLGEQPFGMQMRVRQRKLPDQGFGPAIAEILKESAPLGRQAGGFRGQRDLGKAERLVLGVIGDISAAFVKFDRRGGGGGLQGAFADLKRSGEGIKVACAVDGGTQCPRDRRIQHRQKGQSW